MIDPIQSVLDANRIAMQQAAQQRRISNDLDMLIESDRAMTSGAMTDWLVEQYALEEAQARAAYRVWVEDVNV